MKNAINFLALTLMAGISILSCSKKENIPPWVPPPNPNHQSAAQPDPVANFIINDPFGNVHAPASVYLNNLSLNATSYSWDFGDGTQSTDSFPTHLYANSGTYSIQLIASNGAKKSKATQIANILNPYTQISISQISLSVPPPASDEKCAGPGSLEIYNSTPTKIFSEAHNAYVPIGEPRSQPDYPYSPSNRSIVYVWSFDSLGIASTPLQAFWISYNVNLLNTVPTGRNYVDSSTYNFQPAAFSLGTGFGNSYPSTVSVYHNQTTLTLYLKWQ
jgi:PKD repeat protein